MQAMTATPSLKMTPSDYLAWEREQPVEHQYIAGEIFAMAGGSPRHNALSTNVAATLRGRGCQPLSSHQKVYIPRPAISSTPTAPSFAAPFSSTVDLPGDE
jgi:Uma2 family endonuclease